MNKFYKQNRINIYIYFLIFLSSISVNAQLKGLIIDKESKLPIAFASLSCESGSGQKGVISDVYGAFEIPNNGISGFTVSCIGYKTTYVIIADYNDSLHINVEMETQLHAIEEVMVKSSYNPAHRIIKEVLANKDKNNFDNYENYNYRSYVKTIIDIKLSSDATAKDSAAIRLFEAENKRAGLFAEHVVDVSKNGNKLENKIIAHKTSGLTNPMFVQALALTFHHSISFYNNTVPLFAKPISSDYSINEFASPLANGCLNSYTFLLQDTIVDEQDSVFVIDFSPKKGANFNGLKGKMYIHNNGYALSNIVAEPFEAGLIGFKFRQDYELVDNKWFPKNLYEEIGWVNQKLAGEINAYPVYLISSYINNVNFRSNAIGSNYEKVVVDLLPQNQTDSVLNAVRPAPLSSKELNTIHYMDSIGQKFNFDYKLNLITSLACGKIPLNFIDLNLNELYSYNKYEKVRMGIGVITNEKLSPYFALGGFIGYGLNDKKYKYGGHLQLNLNEKHDVKLKLSLQDNLKEAGVELGGYSADGIYSSLRKYMGQRYDRVVEQKAMLSFRAFRFLEVSSSLSIREFNTMYKYTYSGSLLSNFQSDELQVQLKYAYDQNLSTWDDERILSEKGNPIIRFNYKRGIDIFHKQSLLYQTYETTIDYTYYGSRVGQSDIRFAAGYIDRSLPYGLLFTGEGGKASDMPLLVNNSFQTMSLYEFLSDRYLNLFYSHNFGSLLFSSEKFKPQFIVVQNSSWGNLNNSKLHEIDFNTKEKVYHETGLVINNLLRLNYFEMLYFGLGIGGFYRYGYYGYDSFKDNITMKLSFSFSLK